LNFKTSQPWRKTKTKTKTNGGSASSTLQTNKNAGNARGMMTMDNQRRRQPAERAIKLFGLGGGGRRAQQEVEEDSVEELAVLLLRQVPRVGDHLHRRLLPELPALDWKNQK
jgi:hypothetical protein